MNQKKPVLFMLVFAGIILLIFLIMQPLEVLVFKKYINLLFPKGAIAREQRNLLLILQALMLLVIVPVYILTFIFSWRYRAHGSKTKAKYDPDLVDNRIAEYIWWGFPLVMTLIIAVLTWVKTHELDPFKPLNSDKKPITIQVVALQWKWLFLYPEENIASLNFLQIPKQTPIRFEITADAPMNSFWIPSLGGQIYAMPNMKTILHLIADESGDFRGLSANLSGVGFSDMHFIARASSEEEYQEWVESAKSSSKILNWEQYNQLAAPSRTNPVEFYQLRGEGLFDQIIMKYMHPKERNH